MQRHRSALLLLLLLVAALFDYGPMGLVFAELPVLSWPFWPSDLGSRQVPLPRLRSVTPNTAKRRLSSIAEAERAAKARARDVMAGGAAGIYKDTEFGGLQVLRGAIDAEIISQMREEAQRLNQQGHFGCNNQESEGRGDKTLHLTMNAARTNAMPGLMYGSMLLYHTAMLLNQQRPPRQPALEPECVQLACYDPGGPCYPVHKDEESEDGTGRQVTLILYLQERWENAWGGAFRAYRKDVHTGQSLPEYAEVLPHGGTMVMFRSPDLAHEVLPLLPSSEPRMALAMWCGAASEE